jgi:hypothetical protein
MAVVDPVTSRLDAVRRGLRSMPASFYLMLAFLFFILPINITFGDNKGGSVQVVNSTDYYLHVKINGQPYLYIPPGSGITGKGESLTTFNVEAFYAPGQGVSGKATRTLETPYYPAESGCNGSSASGCECVTSPAAYGSVTWEVTADTLEVGTK